MKVTAFLMGWRVRCFLFLVALAISACFALPFTSLFSASAQQAVTTVNAASFASDGVVTANTIVAVFTTFTTQGNQAYIASTIPLPTTLGGVRVTVNGVAAGLLGVFPASNQINLVIPAGTAAGQATVIVTSSDNTTKSGNIVITQSQPGIFTAKSNGTGTAAAYTTFDGVNITQTANPDGSERELDAGTRTRRNTLVLFLTGLGAVQTSQVTVTFHGVPGQVTFAGPQGAFVGLDQINVIIPWELAGQGIIRVKVSVKNNLGETRESNVVTIRLGGQIPDIVATPITVGQVVNGELKYDDQIQTAGDNVYFFDAYVFTTTVANATVAIDLRSPATGAPADPHFDALVLLYRLTNGRLDLVAANDQTGGIGDGNVDVNNDALLLTVLPQPGTYVLLATTADLQPLGIGTYTLTLRDNVIQPIAYGANVSGSITTTDVKTSGGDYLDAYWFNGVLGDQITVTMRSTAFDSFLLLYRNDSDPEIAFDDNGAGGQVARLTFTLRETGIYLIFATPFQKDKTGAYTLSLTKSNTLTGNESTIDDQAPFVFPGRALRQAGNPNGLAGSYAPSGSTFERASRRRFVVR